MKKICNPLAGIIFIVFTLWMVLATPAHADTNATSTSALVNFHIRYQDTLVFDGQAQIPSSTSTTVTINDDTGVGHTVAGASALNALNRVDQASSAFAISDLQYFSSFGSFYLNCIQITTPSVNACANWQYVVNGVYPFVGIDQYILHAGDDAYLYFGNQHQVSLNSATVSAGQPFSATAQNYQYTTNQWAPLPNVTIGVTQSNLADPFSPLVIASSTVNSLGQATFTLFTPGQYNVGIAQDFYFPSTPLTINPQASSTADLPVNAQSASSTTSQFYSSGGGGGGGGGVIVHNAIDSQKAIQFLASHKNANGSYGTSPFYSDWVAIAFGAYNFSGDAMAALKEYLLKDPFAGNLVTDYERRSMALMSLGLNPYSATPTNYIQKIVNAFDGTQIGDPHLVNDDIFALFPLLNAGVSQDEAIIKNTVRFIISQQRSDGSWEGGVDMTAAAIQALFMVRSLDSMPTSVQKAKAYLKNQQDTTGGFAGNLFSTTWALQAMSAMGEDSATWQKSGNAPDDYLYANQAQDGGLGLSGDINNRIWLTAYAIPAALKKPWGQILVHFSPSSLSLPSFPFTSPLVSSPSATSTLLISAPFVAPPHSEISPNISSLAASARSPNLTQPQNAMTALSGTPQEPVLKEHLGPVPSSDLGENNSQATGQNQPARSDANSSLTASLGAGAINTVAGSIFTVALTLFVIISFVLVIF